MKYWNMSDILGSSLMTPMLANDLVRFVVTGEVVNEHLFPACSHVASCTPPRFSDDIVFAVQVGAPDRRLYLRHPSDDEWLVLERAGIYELEGRQFFHLDALH